MFTTYLLVRGKGFHNGNEQEQIRSKERNNIADLSKDNKHRIPELCEKPKIGKNNELLANPLLSRDYREKKKKTSQLLCTVARKISLSFVAPTYKNLIMMHLLL